MSNRPVADEFETTLRRALDDVNGAVYPPVGLADRLLADVPAGRRPITRLGGPRPATRWALPLLAAASIVAIAVALALVANSGSHHRRTPPVNHTSPVVPPKPPAVPHFRAVDIYFADQQHGWALGDAQCASGGRSNCPTLLATSDGGTSWHATGVPAGLVSTFDSASCGTNGNLAGPCVNGVLFADAANGYLWSLHEIYSTTDAGSHWHRYVDPEHDWDGAAQLVVAGNRVVRLAPEQQCSSGCAGRLETAPVGTTDWRPTRPSSAQIGLYSSVLATAGNDVYLFAGGTVANASPGIFSSSDSGQHWRRVAHDVCGVASSSEQDPFSGDGSVLADDGSLVAYCLNGGPAGSIHVAPPGTASFGAGRRLPTNDSVQIEAAQTDQRIVMASTAHAYDGARSKTTFYLTTDGGQHWQRTETLPVGGAGIRFTSGAAGYAIAADGTGYYVTRDGGTSWQQHRFSA